MATQRRSRSGSPLALALLTLFFFRDPHAVQARRAVVRDGMSTKGTFENNERWSEDGDMTMDLEVVALTRIPAFAIDPLNSEVVTERLRSAGHGDLEKVARDLLASKKPLHVSLRAKGLSGGKRTNWMRATASVGDPKRPGSRPLRAVWKRMKPSETATTEAERKLGTNFLTDPYEDCVKRLHDKAVEVEVLLPRSKSSPRGGPPPSIVYSAVFGVGNVNDRAMVPKARATATIYPNGRKVVDAQSAELAARRMKKGGDADGADEKIHLGLTSIHLPTGPGLIDPSWAKGRKFFWKGRSVGVI